MNRTLLFIAMLCAYTASAQTSLSLFDYYSKKQISLSASWSYSSSAVYGKHMKLVIKNNMPTPITIKIEPGRIAFISADSACQNQVPVKSELLALNPKETDSIWLQTMCISPSRSSPYRGVTFTLVEQKKPEVIAVSETIDQNEYYNSSTAQSAMWCVTGQRPISDIFSRDSILAWRMARTVSDITGQPMPTHINLRDHHIVVLSGSFSYQVTKPVTASLAVYDSNNVMVNQMMRMQPMAVGLHQFRFHVNEIAAEGSKFWVKIIDKDGKVLYEKEIGEGFNETGESRSQKIIFPFTLEKGYKDVTLGVYDSQGKLMAEIFKNRSLGMGNHNINYTLHYIKRDDASFCVKLTSKDGKVILQREVRPKKEEDDKFPEAERIVRLKYPVPYKMKNARCVIYNEYGEEVTTVFEGKSLKEGPNEINYKFTHTYGTKARFILQVVESTGAIIYSKEILP